MPYCSQCSFLSSTSFSIDTVVFVSLQKACILTGIICTMYCRIEASLEMFLFIKNPVDPGKKRKLVFNVLLFLSFAFTFCMSLEINSEFLFEDILDNYAFLYYSAVVYAAYVVTTLISSFYMFSRFRKNKSLGRSKRYSFILMRILQITLTLVSVSYFFIFIICILSSEPFSKDDKRYHFNVSA